MAVGFAKLERRLSRRALLEVRRSDLLWKEHGQRLRLEAFERYILLAVYLAGFPVLVTVGLFGLVAAPYANVATCFHFKAMDDRAPFVVSANSLLDQLQTEPRNGMELGLCLQSLTAAAWFALIRCGVAATMWRSPELAKLALLPVDDDKYMRRGLRQVALLIAAIISYFAMASYLYVAWHMKLGWATYTGAIVLALLQGVAAAALLVCLLGKVRAIFSGAFGLVLQLGCFVPAVFGPFLQPRLDGWLWIGFAVTPPGWINAAYVYGLIGGNPFGWLWLSPVVVMIMVAIARMQTRFAIKEFHFYPSRSQSSRRQVEAVPEDSCSGFKPPLWFFQKWKSPMPTRSASESIQSEILATRSLCSSELHGGWVERLMIRFLTRREWVLLDAMCDRPVSWQSWWNGLALGSLAVIALLGIPVSGELVQLLPSPGILFFVLFAGIIFLGPLVVQAKPAALCRWLPISPREVWKVFWKVQLVFIFLLLPAILLFAALADWRLGGQSGHSTELAGRFIYALLAVLPFGWAATHPRFQGRNHDVSLRRIPALVLAGVIGTISIIATGAILQAEFPLATISGAILLPMISSSVWRHDLRQHLKSSSDWD